MMLMLRSNLSLFRWKDINNSINCTRRTTCMQSSNTSAQFLRLVAPNLRFLNLSSHLQELRQDLHEEPLETAAKIEFVFLLLYVKRYFIIFVNKLYRIFNSYNICCSCFIYFINNCSKSR